MSAPSIDFIRKFRATATQLNTSVIAGDWMRLSRELGFTAEVAAGWAGLGFMPAEAAPKIRAGMTVAEARQEEQEAAKRFAETSDSQV